MKAAKMKKKNLYIAKKPKKNHFLLRLLIVLFAIAAAITAAWLVWRAPQGYATVFYTVESAEISDGMRIMQLSDLHGVSYGEDNASLIASAEALSPDLIVLTGDMADYTTGGEMDFDGLYSLCASLSDISPVLFCYGNDEYDAVVNYGSNMTVQLEKAGVTVLGNRVVSMEINGNLLSIGGLSECGWAIGEYAPDFEAELAGSDGFRLLLTHYPENLKDYISSDSYELALAGHTHGGIVVLPIVGALYANGQGWFPDYAGGEYNIGSSTLIVSRGLSDTELIPRINDPPEITVIDLRAGY